MRLVRRGVGRPGCTEVAGCAGVAGFVGAAGCAATGAAGFRFGATAFVAGLIAVEACGFGSDTGFAMARFAVGVAGAGPRGDMTTGRATGRETLGRA